MNQAVEAFLNKVWKEITTIYEQESKRINEFKDQRTLQAGVHNYLRVTWRKGKFTWAKGKIHIGFTSRHSLARINLKRILTSWS